MPEPSTQALHVALSRSFATPSKNGRRAAPLAEVLSVLEADLRTPGDKRKRAPLPRVVLGLALWNLAARHFDLRKVPAADHAAVGQLDRLSTEVFGWSLAELNAMRRQHLDPLLTIARQYKILDYRWSPPAAAAPAFSATLEVLVQRPLQHVRRVVEPRQWRDACPLFWTEVAPSSQRSFDALNSPRPVTFRAAIGVPGVAPDGRPTIGVDCQLSASPLGFTNAFSMSGERSDGRGQAVFCRGSISAAKEKGGPWMTRITHTKEVALGDNALVADGADILSYWMQAETACLVASC